MDDYVGMAVTIVGWGLNKKGALQPPPTLMQKAPMDIVPHEQCYFQQLLLRPSDYKTKLCASRSAACSGDSGGNTKILSSLSKYLSNYFAVL